MHAIFKSGVRDDISIELAFCVLEVATSISAVERVLERASSPSGVAR